MGLANVTAAQVCEQLLQFDESPPSDDYTAQEFGRVIADSIATEIEAIQIINTVLRKLPSGIAAGFLEGFMPDWLTEKTCTSLYDCLGVARELTSASTIVQLLDLTCKINRHLIYQEIHERLQHSVEPSAQEQCCFAIWVLICGERFDFETNDLYRSEAVAETMSINLLLSRDDLTPYCVTLLTQCREVLSVKNHETN